MEAPRDAVSGGERLAELGVHQVPPAVPLEDLGALVRDVAAGVPERLRGLPGEEIARHALGDDPSPTLGAFGVAGGDEHAPQTRGLVAEDERVAPVGRLVAGRRAERVLGVALPGAHAIGAGGVQHELQGEAVGADVGGVLPRVEHVVDAVFDDDAAGVDVEVVGIRAAGGHRLAGLGEGDEVVGDHAVPGHADLGGAAGLVQIEEVEASVFLPGDDVADPGVGRAEEPSFVHADDSSLRLTATDEPGWLIGYADASKRSRGWSSG
ncbi:hypothetical protein QE392_000059 [Microbacterium proteolyticum]|nr:hypothetical protein [Microbacterium proteolyticum]